MLQMCSRRQRETVPIRRKRNTTALGVPCGAHNLEVNHDVS
jgi:hypothetical protein